MKRLTIYLIGLLLSSTLFAENLNITTIDTGYYPVNDGISFYFSLLDNQGNPLTKLDRGFFQLYERDLKSGEEYEIKKFELAQTDKKLKSANFLFLVDNSLSMYRLVLPTSFSKNRFEGEILPSLTASEQSYLLKFYRKAGSVFTLGNEPPEQSKQRVKTILAKANVEVKNRIETVQESMELFLNSMPPELDNKLFVSFNEKSSSMQSFTKSNDQIKRRFAAVERPDETTGWTELYEALNETVTNISRKGGRSFLILLSDGYQRSASKEDKSPILKEAIQKALDNNIIIFTIGFGGEVDHQLLKELASSTGGVNINAGDTNYLNDAYTKISNIIYTEFKVTYKGKNLLPEERELIVRYKGLEKRKLFKISSIYGKSLHPYPWLLLLLIALALLILLFLLFKFLKKEVKEPAFINLDSSTKVLVNSDTVWLAGKNESTRVVKKDDNYVLEGENTSVNNNEISGTRVLKEGDVITTSSGTRLLFSGTFKLDDKDKDKDKNK